MYFIRLLAVKVRLLFMSRNDKLLYAYARRYRVIGTCGGYRIQYSGFLLKDNNHENIVFETLDDMVIFLALND